MKQLKGLPRGRPFPPGVSGNPQGRPRGSLNVFSRLIKEELSRAAEEERRKPRALDKDLPFQTLSDCFMQFGRRFSKSTLREITPGAPPPIAPERFISGPYQLIKWEGKVCLVQNGFLFDYKTHLRIDP